MRAAQEEARRATLAEQAVFSKYEEEVTAHWWAKSEKAKAVEACKSANQAKDLDLKRVEQEKDLRHRAEEEKAEHLATVEQASRETSAAQGEVSHQTRLAKEATQKAARLGSLLQVAQERVGALEKELTAERQKGAAQAELTQKLTAGVTGTRPWCLTLVLLVASVNLLW
jgi:hypothetical protein